MSESRGQPEGRSSAGANQQILVHVDLRRGVATPLNRAALRRAVIDAAEQRRRAGVTAQSRRA